MRSALPCTSLCTAPTLCGPPCPALIATVCGCPAVGVVVAAGGAVDGTGAIAVAVSLSRVTLGVTDEPCPPAHATAALTNTHAKPHSSQHRIVVIGAVSHPAVVPSSEQASGDRIRRNEGGAR